MRGSLLTPSPVCREADLRPIFGDLGPILGPSSAILSRSWAIFGELALIFGELVALAVLATLPVFRSPDSPHPDSSKHVASAIEEVVIDIVIAAILL